MRLVKLLLRPDGVRLLREVAMEWHGLEVRTCWAWCSAPHSCPRELMCLIYAGRHCDRDLHGERASERFGPAWVVKRLLRRLLEGMVQHGLLPDRSTRAAGRFDCCVHRDGCLEHYGLVAGRAETWYSLPCAPQPSLCSQTRHRPGQPTRAGMHWMCHPCAESAMYGPAREARAALSKKS